MLSLWSMTTFAHIAARYARLGFFESVIFAYGGGLSDFRVKFGFRSQTHCSWRASF